MPLSSRHVTAARAPLALLAALTLLACSETSPPMNESRHVDVLRERVESALRSADQAVVPAATLTDFPWQQMCFRRDDALLLTFRDGTAETVLTLDYDEFFVDEDYVAGSLDGECLAYTDTLLVRRKYPRDAGPVEFMKASAAVSP